MKERQIVQFLHRYRCLWVVIKILWPLAQQLESYICALLWSRADIDECVTSPCSQRCENNAGSYRCLCNAGFSLNSTTGECIGNNATRRIPWRLKQDLISHLIYPVTLETGSHLSSHLKREGRWGTTDDFATSFLPFPLFSTALWDLANSRPVHSLMLSSHLFLCLPCLLPPFTVLSWRVFRAWNLRNATLELMIGWCPLCPLLLPPSPEKGNKWGGGGE